MDFPNLQKWGRTIANIYRQQMSSLKIIIIAMNGFHKYLSRERES